MRLYNTDFKRLALLTLPTFMRRPILAGLAMTLVSPVKELHTQLLQYRETSAYRLGHNGQVCKLRGVLNDRFDPVERRITITDGSEGSRAGVLLHRREVDRAVFVPLRGSGAVILNRRGYGGASGYDFWVNVPSALMGDVDENLLHAVTDMYKLASKRYGINYQ